MTWDSAFRYIASFFVASPDATQAPGDEKSEPKEGAASPSFNEKPDQTSKPVGPPNAFYSIGTCVHVEYDGTNASHRERGSKMWRDGVFRVVSRSWKPIIHSGAVVLGEVEIESSTICSTEGLTNKLKCSEAALYIHPSDPPDGSFIVTPDGKLELGYKEVCIVKADMSGLTNSLKRKDGPDGQYVRPHCKIVIKWDSDHDCLKAFLRWEEGGVQKCGPETIVPDALCK